MRRLQTSLLLLLLALLAVAAPAHAIGDASLSRALARIQADMGPYSGASVVDLATGQSLYASGEDVALVPASNEKLFTTATALLRFGPATTLPTSVRATVDTDGVVRGDLFLVGGGDPSLDDAGLTTLALQVATAGVTRITGAVVGDDSRFDALRGGPATRFGYDPWLGGALTALSWRHGRTRDGSPAKAAAIRFGQLLKAQGIRYGRRPRAGTVPALTAQAARLATVASPPMSTLVQTTNVASENFYAEMLAKDLGASFGGVGSTTAGLGVVRDELGGLEVHPRLVDGSGLSRANRTTARQLTQLLVAMDGHEITAAWRASLAVAGRTGTIRLRMRGTAAQDRCQAKTGTLSGVSALSGYCDTLGGRRVAFSLLENRVCTSCAKRLEDRMVAAIARLDAVPAAAARSGG